MQSEIDEIRMALTGLGILRDAEMLNADEVSDFIAFVSLRLDLIEAQQAGAAVRIPVVRLSDLASGRPRPALHVINGERVS